MGLFHYHNLEDSEVFIFDDFLITQIKEDVFVEERHNEKLNEIIQKYFLGKNIAYISNRAKSYSVNPLVYRETEKIPNLVAVAIIPETLSMRNSAEFEKEFYDKPYGIFDNLSHAVEWVHAIIKEHKVK
ncbi:hypothetical protein [Lacinutrix mariniflava]|uniref:hypothetical protein n=1 Tax=Lacinutrix mariniflava TaxID=342955 RepID=UPI0006E1FA43|nr:hypothetical protein [Lacinutrix mariniflava]